MRWVLVNPDNPKSVGARMRARRWAMLVAAFPDLEDAKVLDVGGNPRSGITRRCIPRTSPR